MARLHPELRSFTEETDRLLALLASITAMASLHRKVIAEIVHLRLAILLENHMKIIMSKLCCGTAYLDGTLPNLLVQQTSAAAAVTAMKTLNRTKAINVSWNDGPSIRAGVEHIVDPVDHCITVLRNFGSHFTEMRYIRNHIAHRNEGSRTNFRKLVRTYYGANVPGITSGLLLLSPTASTPPLIEVHIRKSRTLIKDMLKAP
jgi:hypothetical protein